MSHFGVKVAIIEPGYFKTAVTDIEMICRTFRERWDRANPEVKEVYGEKFLVSSECFVVLGKEANYFLETGPSLEPLTFSRPSSKALTWRGPLHPPTRLRGQLVT